MFILTNNKFEENIEFVIFQEDDKTILKSNIDQLELVGTETKLGCNLYVIERNEDSEEDVIITDNMKKAKVIECEIVYETGIVQDVYNTRDLVRTFGSKKSIDRLKTIEVDGYLKKPTLKVEGKTQILPMISSKGKNIMEYFKLEDMFSEEILNSLREVDFEEVDLLNESKVVYNNLESNKIRVLLLDGLLRLINFKYVTEDVLENTIYSKMIDLVIEDIENRRLSKMGRDKLIIKAYILILQMNGGKVKLASIPSFNMKIEAVMEYFKILGCVYNRKTDELKVVFKPMENIHRSF